jgi:hypothetical protein
MYREVEVRLHTFLTSERIGGDLSASGLGGCTPETEPPVRVAKEAGWAQPV